MALTDKQRMPKDKTNFPKQGDNQKISLRNSNYPQFDYGYASRLREGYPSIWSKGGNIRGNSAFTNWGKARDGSDTDAVLDWIREREAWSARHFKNKNIAGVVAQVKWGMIGSRGEGYMKDLINEAKKKVDKDKSGGSKMELKHMNVSFEVKEYNDEDEYFSFAGYGSTSNNVDLGNDRVMPGAFKQCIEEMARSGKNLPVLWQHDMTMPLGTYVEMYEDAKGLYVKGRMPKADDFVRGRVMPQMKAGSIDSMSIGYMANQWEMDGDIRNLKEITLYEISLVTMPMNPDAMITDMKTKEVGIDDFKDLTVREIDSVLRSGVKMTRKATKKFISCLDVEKLREADDDSARDAGKGASFDSFKAMIEEIKKI